MLRNAVGRGGGYGVHESVQINYQGVRSSTIIVTRGGCVQFQEKYNFFLFECSSK